MSEQQWPDDVEDRDDQYEGFDEYLDDQPDIDYDDEWIRDHGYAE
jgi:hypothetical protein